MEHVFKLDDFEGPLDLLLHLIKNDEKEIFDVSISTLTSQYLELIESHLDINLEIASEYLVMAATLIEIKASMLLPKPEIVIDSEYEEDSREALVRKLIEYKKYKDVSKVFNDLNNERSLIYTKPLEDLDHFKSDEKAILPDGFEIYDLMRSMEKMMNRMAIQKPMTTKLENNEISVDQRSKTLIQQLKSIGKKTSLYDLIDIKTKTYLIVTFLSVLDLVKQNKIIISQSFDKSEIFIEGVN